MGIPIMQKQERRTGARVFVWSGAVGNDPGVFVKIHVGDIIFELAQWDIDRTRDVAALIRFWIAHIHEDGCASVVRGQRPFQRNPRDICFGGGEFRFLYGKCRFDDHNRGGCGFGGWQESITRQGCKYQGQDCEDDFCFWHFIYELVGGFSFRVLRKALNEQ
jgi:hypothetical protein